MPTSDAEVIASRPHSKGTPHHKCSLKGVCDQNWFSIYDNCILYANPIHVEISLSWGAEI